MKETITIDEIKELTTNLILEYMNADIQPPTNNELLQEQKTEIKQKIHEYCNRPGIMSISFRDDFGKDIAEVNALIDPTNRNNWIALREELIYKLPYSYKNALHSFAAEVWKTNKAV